MFTLCVTSFGFGLAAYIIDDEIDHRGFLIYGQLFHWFAVGFGFVMSRQATPTTWVIVTHAVFVSVIHSVYI